jgi:hypothetical protein
VKCGLVLLMLSAFPCWSQTTTTGKAETKGPCSPAVTGSGNTISIKTCGMSAQEMTEFQQALRNILSNEQLDTAAILKKLDGCLQTMSDRHLTGPQKQSILAAIGTSPGHKIIIATTSADEAKIYATEFVKRFESAQWTLEYGGLLVGLYSGPDPVGIVILISQVDADTHNAPPDAKLLMINFLQIGLIKDPTFYPNREVRPGETKLLIGTKPPLPPLD